MQQLSGLDAAFLVLESGSTLAHVGSVCVLQGEPELTVERLREVVRSRLDWLPVCRRRLVTVPGGIDHPWWAEVSDLDLGYHVTGSRLPAGPGSSDQRLAGLVASLHERRLDRTRPLWEMHLVTGLSGGRVALYSKVHHAALDGIAGGDLLTALLDPSPVAPAATPCGPVAPTVPERAAYLTDQVPTPAWLLARGLLNLARWPFHAARLAARVVRAAPAVAGTLRPLTRELTARDVLGWLRAPRLWAPPTPFNAPISASRTCAFATLPLADVKTIRRGSELTVNDVLMTLVAGALRQWLLAHDALPAASLVAAVPVSVRGGRPGGVTGPAIPVAGRGSRDSANRLSFLLAALPTTLEGSADRLEAMRASLQRAKAGHAAIPRNLIADLTQLTPPVLGAAEWRLLVRLRALQWGGFNLVISNVPGPSRPLYLAGAELLAWYPVSAVADGQGLNVTVITYRGTVHVGLLACPELIPDLETMAGYLREEVAALVGSAPPATWSRNAPTRASARACDSSSRAVT